MELANGSQLCLKAKTGSSRNFGPKLARAWKLFWDGNLDTRLCPWAWGATSVPCPLGSMHGLAHVKGPKETDPYPPNHTSLISPICRMGLGQYNMIWYMNWAHNEVELNWVELVEMCHENGYQQILWVCVLVFSW